MKKSLALLVSVVALCAVAVFGASRVPAFFTSGTVVKNDLVIWGDPLENGDIPFAALMVVSKDETGRPAVVLQHSCIREDGSECLDPDSMPRFRVIDGRQPGDEHPSWPRR